MTSSTINYTWDQGAALNYSLHPLHILNRMFAEGVRSNHWIWKVNSCVRSSRKVSQSRRDTGHFHRQRWESRKACFNSNGSNHVWVHCRPRCGEDCSPDSGSPPGCREELCVIPQASRRHSSVFSQGSNKIPALLWEDYLGSSVKDGLGETCGGEISWVSLQ